MNFKSNTPLKKLSIITLALSALLMSFGASSQNLKIGVVNVAQLLERSPQAQSAMDALREEFAPRQREILAKQKQAQEIEERLERDQAVMGESERRGAQRDLRDMQRDLARGQQEYLEDLNARRNEELQGLQRSLLQEVQAYAQSENYDLVVGDGVLFASAAVNITDEVLKGLEGSFE